MINDLRSKLGQIVRSTEGNGRGNGGWAGSPGDVQKQQVNVRSTKFACWHCKSKKQKQVGKPPVKGSFFWKKRQKEKPDE